LRCSDGRLAIISVSPPTRGNPRELERAQTKRIYWAGDWNGETDGKAWRGQHQQLAGSWWQDWARWLGRHCGPLQAPPPAETKDYPALCPAPGT
jgi:polyhydroxyalkanoate synthase